MKNKKLTNKKIDLILTKSKYRSNNSNFSGYSALYHTEGRYRMLRYLLSIRLDAIIDKRSAYAHYYKKCREHLTYLERGGEVSFAMSRYVSN